MLEKFAPHFLFLFFRVKYYLPGSALGDCAADKAVLNFGRRDPGPSNGMLDRMTRERSGVGVIKLSPKALCQTCARSARNNGCAARNM